MKFKSLKSRIAVIFLTLILGIQVMGFFAIRSSIEKNARNSVNEQLEIGEKVFLSLLKQNGESLSQGARILAIDYGFREAIGSHDTQTILSALNNHQARLGADISVFFTSENEDLVISGDVKSEAIKSSIISLVESAQNAKDGRSFAIFNQQPYQLVAVPIKAPITIGWVIMGFKINDLLVQKLNKLSNLQVTFISKTGESVWLPTASTLSMPAFAQLVAKLPAVIQPKNTHDELTIEDIAYGTRYVPIFVAKNQSLYAVLQRSIDEATAAYQELNINLLLLTIIGLTVIAITILYVSSVITKPIAALVDSAKSLEEGNFDIAINTNREDELGHLSRSFNSMTAAIVAREKNIIQLAFFDELTKLPNRASFMNEMSNAINMAEKHHQSLSILMLNLDRFKQINNILGHDAGDAILRILADRIKTIIKNGNDFVARVGGDQFAILLPKTNPEIALQVAKSVLKTLETPIQMLEQTVDLSASVGMANFPDHAHNAAELISKAEIALHIAKTKNIELVSFDKKYDLHSAANLSLESDLKLAISGNQLELYVQPKIDTQTAKVASLEALIRWKHPEKGYIFPDQFIPFAEQTGFIHHISMWMLNEAARLVALWKTQNIQIPIAINISTRDLIDQNLTTKILEIFERHTITLDALAISLEITESSIMDDPVRALATLDKLAAMQIKLSIDDFGTGYSSLAYLKKLPVSELKIDKSFVLKLEQDEDDRKIVQSTIDLGHNLGLKVVAEGVENKAVWDLLAQMGCDYGQGYYMGRPMHNAQFMQWLAAWETSPVHQEIKQDLRTKLKNIANQQKSVFSI